MRFAKNEIKKEGKMREVNTESKQDGKDMQACKFNEVKLTSLNQL